MPEEEMMQGRFSKGWQPCKDFKGRMEANAHAVWENRHECFGKDRNGKYCDKLVSYCENCSTDHHENGYETCASRCKKCGTNGEHYCPSDVAKE